MKTYLQKIGMTLALTLVSVVGWGQLSYTNGYPTITSITPSSIAIESQYDNFPTGNEVRIRCVVLPDGATPPTTTDINLSTYFASQLFIDEEIIYNNSIINIQISGLAVNTNYTAYIVTRNRDTGVDIETSPTMIKFTTSIPLSIIEYMPLQDETVASITTSELILTFSENIKTGTTGSLTLKIAGDGSVASFLYDNTNLNITENVLTVPLTNNLEYNTTYYIIMDEGFVVTDTEASVPCNAISNTTDWQFKTEEAPAPLTSLDVEGTAVSLMPQLKILFDQPVQFLDGTEITSSNVRDLILGFYDQNNNNVTDFNITISADKKTITIDVLSMLIENTDYILEVDIVENYNNLEQSEIFTANFSVATYNKWLGGTSAWTTKTNWSSGILPGINSYVWIKKTNNNPIFNSSSISIKGLIIDPEAGITTNSLKKLTINDHLWLYSNENANAFILDNEKITINNPSRTKIYQKITSDSRYYTISSPVTSATTSTINANGGFSTWRATDGTWQSYTGTLTPGVGYLSYSSTDYIFSGTINTTAPSIKAYNNASNAGWLLAGNPYPCTIDWRTIYPASSNIKNEFQILLNGTNTYGSYNGVSGLGANLDATTPYYIPSNHAFWVRVYDIATKPSTGTLTIPTNSRVASNKFSYLKSASSDKQYLRLSGHKGAVKDEMVVAFMDGAADTYEDYDSKKKWSFVDNFDLLEVYSLSSTTPLIINSYTNFNGCKTVPLGIKTKAGGAFKIQLDEINNFPDDVSVELYDLLDPQKEIVTDLTAEGSYSFSLTGATTNNSRFVLLLKSASQSTPTSLNKLTKIDISENEGKLFISLPELTNPTIEVFDIQGRLIMAQRMKPSTINVVDMDKTGLFIVKFKSLEETYQEKVLLTK